MTNPMPNLKETYREFLYYLGTKLAHRPAQKSPMISMHVEGAPATVVTKDGTTFITSDGDLTVNFSNIMATVGIKNLTEVTEHQITTILGSRSHLVRFVNGGELRFAYNSLGQLLELSARELIAHMSKGHVITFAIPDEQTQDEGAS